MFRVRPPDSPHPMTLGTSAREGQRMNGLDGPWSS